MTVLNNLTKDQLVLVHHHSEKGKQSKTCPVSVQVPGCTAWEQNFSCAGTKHSQQYYDRRTALGET
mgnify:CR=1 FL=1